MDSLQGKKVLYVITKSNWGGAQAYVYTLAAHAKAAGADVHVALGGTGLPGAEEGLLGIRLREAGITTHLVRAFTRDISFFREFSAYAELRSLVESVRPDILHVNSSKAGGIGALIGRRLKIPRVLFTAHGWAHREPRPVLTRLAIRAASWATIALSHAVIAVSLCDMETAPALFFRRKLHLVHVGVPSVELLPREEARQALSSARTDILALPFWILMNSELHPNKGVDVAIHAFASEKIRFKNTALVVISPGEEHARLEKLIESYGLSHRVALLGFVAEARRYLSAGDLFLMPSRKEGLPMALLEAGLASLPAIASSVGGIPEIITDGANGLLVPPRDIDALADAITSLLLDTDRAKELGSALRGTVTARFSEREMVDKTLSLYQKP